MDFSSMVKLRETEDIANEYMICEQLGEGNFGTVCAGKHRRTDVECAIKIINKVELLKKGDRRLFNLLEHEIGVLQATSHPNIVRIFQLLEDKTNIYCAMELMGGSLDQYIKNKKNKISEEMAVYIMRQLCKAIKYMHCHNIAHRDLKPANILMQDSTLTPTRPRIKVTDFGFATHLVQDNETLSYKLGSARYKAPELVDRFGREKHDEKVDIWAIGCLAFEIFARE